MRLSLEPVRPKLRILFERLVPRLEIGVRPHVFEFLITPTVLLGPVVVDGGGFAEDVASFEFGAGPACCADEGRGGDVDGFHPVHVWEGECGEKTFG